MTQQTNIERYILFLLVLAAASDSLAAEVTIKLTGFENVAIVAAVDRWDQDGNPRRPVDQKAKIDAPAVDAKAVRTSSGTWVFRDLPPGNYDLLILTKDRLRIEGFRYAPVLEFDPFFPADATADEETSKLISKKVRESRHFENRVQPLYLGGDKKTVRVLVMLIRDKPTSYTPGLGTIRHEIWQFTFNYGGWQKEQRTRVLDRVLMPVVQLRRWTWLWEPKLGGIEVKKAPITIRYALPKPAGGALMGLRPY